MFPFSSHHPDLHTPSPALYLIKQFFSSWIFFIYIELALFPICNFFFFHVQIVYISLNFSIPQTKTSSHRYFRTRISNKQSILCLAGISTLILFLFSLAFGLVLSIETGELMHQTIYTESVLGWPGREH